MLKKTISYTDYLGNERSESFYFNYSQAEIIEMDMGTEGGIQAYLHRIGERVDAPEILNFWKKFILGAYGEKSADGRRFVKSPELSEAFSQTEAYSNMFMEMISEPNSAAAFVAGVIPSGTIGKKDKPASLLSDDAETDNKVVSLLSDE